MYPNFASHVASMLLADEPKERNELKCEMPTVDAWCLKDEDEEVINLVKSTPLYNLLSSYKTYDLVIISTFVERRHPETNTFHLPIGEMTITLDDVYQLTHLSITEKAIFPKSQPKEKTMSEYVARVLGVSEYEARQEIDTNWANSLRLGWLLRKFSKNERSKLENVGVFKGTNEDLARAFLLRLIGYTIFCDSCRDKVSVMYLRFLEDLSMVGKWAWGAAVLAFLYRKLGQATRIEAKLLAGYHTLLQAWVYGHFAFLRPNETKNVAPDGQRMLKWEPKTRTGKKNLNSSVTMLRMKLDGLKKDQVTWTPYRSKDASPDEVVWFTSCLIIDNIKEPYHPDLVVHQFGRIQGLHSPPIALSEESRSSKTKAYKVKYDGHPDDYFNYKNHVLNTSSRGSPMLVDDECTQEYEDWYNAHALRRLNYVAVEGNTQKDRSVIHVVAGEKDVTTKFQAADKAIGMIRKAVANKKITKAELVQVCEEAVRVYDDANKRKTRRSFEEASSSSIPPKKKKKVVPGLRL